VSEQDDVRALLGAYAVDAVDADERRAVESLVAVDADAARELADLQAVAARLGAAIDAEPPAGARAAVLAAVRATPQESPVPSAPPVPLAPTSPTSSTSSTSSARGRRGGARWWALAAAVAIGAAVPATLLVQQVQHTRQVQAEQQQVADLLTDPSAVLVHQDVPGDGAVTAILTDHRAVFTATQMPPPDDGSVYQLWVVRDGQPHSAGVMTSDDGTVRQFADDFAPGDVLAVTVEPAGGSEQPTSDPIMVLSAA